MKTLAALASLLILAACAANDPSADAADKRYTTGSNLPLRDRNVKVITADELEQLRNSPASTVRKPGT